MRCAKSPQRSCLFGRLSQRCVEFTRSYAMANIMDLKRFQMRYTLGRAFDDSPYHIAVIRSPLTRNLSNRFDDIRDEIVESFKDHIPATEGEVYLRQKGGFTYLCCWSQNGLLSQHILLSCTLFLALATGFSLAFPCVRATFRSSDKV